MKLNSQLSIKLTSEEKIKLQELAEKLGVSLNYLVRAMLNGMYSYIYFYGLESIYFSVNKIVLGNLKDKIKK